MPTKKHSVLIVDDNQDSANSMSDVLIAVGFEVKTCFDGPTALEVAKWFHPDACVLDISMPGMDGYELARQLREQSPEYPPVLATMTARGDDTHLERAVEAGFDLQFTKPADPIEVAKELVTSCARARRSTNPEREAGDDRMVPTREKSDVR